MQKYLNKLEKYEQALNSLNSMINFSETIDTPLEEMNDAIRDSIIKRFEYTFELAWKTLKSYFEEEGFEEITSPKRVLKTAFENNIIINENLWANMLEARNATTHRYDEEDAIYYENIIKKEYVNELEELLNKLKDE